MIIWTHVDPVMVLLTIDGETIVTTPEHPFFVSGGEWVHAGNLQPGDKIRNANWGEGTVEVVMFTTAPQMMYNFTVATAHTYFVGEGKWLVHNDCGKVALGLENYLGSFSTEKGASSYTKWFDDGVVGLEDLGSSGDFFTDMFTPAMNNAKSVHFNTAGMGNLQEAIRNGTQGRLLPNNYTNTELYMILHNREWYNKTTFYDADGKVISLEFLGEYPMVDVTNALREQLAKADRIAPCHYAVERYFRELRRLVISAESSAVSESNKSEKVFMLFMGVEYMQLIPNWEAATFSLVVSEERKELLHQIRVIGNENYPRVFLAQPQGLSIVVVCSIVQVLNSMPLS